MERECYYSIMKLLDLPNELLDAIVLSGTNARATRNLRDLRLVCKRFAQLHSVLTLLFEHVHLIADTEQTSSLTPKTLAASGVAPFVRHITFVPALRYPMSLMEFKDIFRDQARHRYGCYDPKHLPRAHLGATFGTPLYSPYLHSEEDLEEGYLRYNTLAHSAHAFMTSQTMQDQWSAILSLLPSCGSFRFALVDYNMLGLSLQPMRPHCIIAGDRRSRQDVRLHCDRARAENIADTFFESVIHILCALSIPIAALNCNQISLSTRTKVHSALALSGPDVSALRHLLLEPDPYRTDFALARARGVLGRQDVSHFVAHSTGSLEHYQVRSSWLLSWSDKPVALPNLRVLDMELIRFTPRGLAEWLELLPALERIKLESMELIGEGNDGEGEPSKYMKCMFDALRVHGTLRKGELGFHGWDEDVEHAVVFDKDGGVKDEEVEGMRGLSVIEEAGMLENVSLAAVDRWVGMYICGKIEWKGALEMIWGEQIEV
jgi:hypothetical protein